jgi:hypothetical protein
MTSSALLIAEGGGDADDDFDYGSTGEQEVDRAHTGMGMFGVSELCDLPNPSPLAFAVGRRPPGRQEGRKEGRITRIASRYAYYSGRVFVRHFSGPGLVSMLCVVASGWPARPLSLMRWTP